MIVITLQKEAREQCSGKLNLIKPVRITGISFIGVLLLSIQIGQWIRTMRRTTATAHRPHSVHAVRCQC